MATQLSSCLAAKQVAVWEDWFDISCRGPLPALRLGVECCCARRRSVSSSDWLSGLVQGLLAGVFSLFACLAALAAAAGLLHCSFVHSVPVTALGTGRAFVFAQARWRFSTGKQNSG